MDYDNSRDIDLYVVNWDGPNQLYSNQRDGSFVEVARVAGAEGGSGRVSAAIGDWNRDSYLDLLLGASASDSIRLLINQGRNQLFLAQELKSEPPTSQSKTHSWAILRF